MNKTKYYIRILSEEDISNSIVTHAVADSLQKAIKWCRDNKYATKRGKFEFFDASPGRHAVHMTKWIHYNSKYLINIYEIQEV